MFKHIFVNRLKIIFGNKASIFWTLVFPIVLATFFSLAFSNLTSSEKFKAFDIAVVKNTNMENDKNFSEMLSSISKEDDNKIFNINYVDEQEAKELLMDNKIKGYIVYNEKIDIVVNANGLEQTIIKSVVDSYYQTTSIIGQIQNFNPAALKGDIITKINSNDSIYFNDISNKNVDFTVVFFYSLIGMVCMYSGFFGVDAVNDSEANLSKKGARLSISPASKILALVISLIIAFMLQFAENMILLSYMIFVLGINFGNQIGYVILLMAIGSIAGISLGTLIGACSKKSPTAKVGIVLAISMTCSFLAGMMMWQMKYIISNSFPIINQINPVAMITDGLYSLYYYSTLDKYWFNIVCLIIFSAIMIITSCLFLRRKRYDSI